MYCIEAGTHQQCVGCQLIDGKLFIGNYQLPNCPGTQWVQIQSYPGTNNTPVYQVQQLPLDSWLLVGFMAVFGTFKIIRNKI